MIDALINKQDTFEIVRNKIGAILVAESASQQILAAAAAEDPNDWKLRVYTERSNPFEEFLNEPPVADRSPIINIWVDNTNFEEDKSNIMERQVSETTYNIDIYGYAVAEDVPAGGHKPGDREAAFECQRAVRLVRNILMSDQYVYLEMQGTVWQRWPVSISFFQPEQDGDQLQQIVAARLAFRVRFNEFSPQNGVETLELVAVDIKRLADGLLVAEADFQYPLP